MFRTEETLILPESLGLQQAGIMRAFGVGITTPGQLDQMLADPDLANALEDTPDNVQIYRGRTIAKRFGVAVQGSGARARGRITGAFITYDYTAAYQVYNLPRSTAAKYWFITYSRSSNNSELRKVAENSVTGRVNYDLSFELQGNDRGITSVYIFYEVIRMKLNGTTKDFVVANPQSSGAVTPDGAPYPGGFTPVEQVPG